MKSPPQDRLNSQLLERFIGFCRVRTMRGGKMIITASKLADRIFYLVDGSVEVLIEDEKGHEMILAYLNKGHFFGEMGYFDKNRNTRSAWVRARGDCTVADMSYDEFTALAHDHPGLVVELATQMALRLYGADAKLGSLAFLDVKGRIAHMLLDLCLEPDATVVDEGWRLEVSRPQLARLVGCSREMVWRVLKTLQSEGLVFDVDNGIVVRHQGVLRHNQNIAQHEPALS